MSINHNHRVAHITTPHDKKLSELNQKLNKTYVPYGKDGQAKMQRQSKQDIESESISSALMAKRTKSKASSMYNNASWDLVDAVSEGDVNIQDLPAAKLPAILKNMDNDQKTAYVQKKTAERKALKEEIKHLSEKRDEFVNLKKNELGAPTVNTVNDAMSSSVRKLGINKNYEFKK